MPRAKTYKGTPVINHRWGDRRQYWIGHYQRYGIDLGVYSDSFDQIVKLLAKRIRNKQQNILHFGGDTGSGKSTLAIQMCKALATRLNTTFDLEADYIYGVEDLWDKLNDPNASPISLFDEATVTLNRGNARSRGDRDIVVMFDTMRSRGWSSFLVSPDISQINKSVVQIHVNYEFECCSPDTQFVKGIDRGLFEFKDKRIPRRKANKEPYWNVLTTGYFDPLDDDTDAIYQRIKRERQDALRQIAIQRNKKEEGLA